jgi:hypothetical protein
MGGKFRSLAINPARRTSAATALLEEREDMTLLPRIAPAVLGAPILILALLAGCATVSPEARVRSKLIEAGLRPPVAGCMAERMVDRLSLVQLKRLQSLGGLAKRDMGMMSLDELVHRLRALNDPEIVSVVLKAGIGCSIAA